MKLLEKTVTLIVTTDDAWRMDRIADTPGHYLKQLANRGPFIGGGIHTQMPIIGNEINRGGVEYFRNEGYTILNSVDEYIQKTEELNYQEPEPVDIFPPFSGEHLDFVPDLDGQGTNITFNGTTKWDIGYWDLSGIQKLIGDLTTIRNTLRK